MATTSLLGSEEGAIDAADFEGLWTTSFVLGAGVSLTVVTSDSEGMDVRDFRFGVVAVVLWREGFEVRGTISRSSSEAYDESAASTASLSVKGLEVRGKSTLL